MAELIAVSTFPVINPDRNLKREALLFDRLEVFGLSKLLEIAHRWNGDRFFTEWQYLRKIGFLRDPRIQFVVPADEADSAPLIAASPAQLLERATPESLQRVEDARLEMEAICRDYAGRVRSEGFADSVYLGDRSMRLAGEECTSRDEVLRVVLRQLPMPNEKTTWDAIAEFRRDETAIAKYRALRNWMNDVGRDRRTASEIEDELLHLISEYQQALKLHRIRATSGVVEALVTTSAEVLGNLASFQWGKAAKAVFELRKHDLALREAEHGAPGKQVAYLIDVANRFV